MQELLIIFSDLLRPVIQEEVSSALQSFTNKLHSPQKEPRFYTRKETSKMLNVSLVTLTQYVKSGKVKANRIGHRVLFRAEDIEACLNQIQTSLRK